MYKKTKTNKRQCPLSLVQVRSVKAVQKEPERLWRN